MCELLIRVLSLRFPRELATVMAEHGDDFPWRLHPVVAAVRRTNILQNGLPCRVTVPRRTESHFVCIQLEPLPGS